MNAVGMADVVLFARRWLEAGSHIVQYWPSWESQARIFFGDTIGKNYPSDDTFHGLMQIVCCVCFGSAEVVKESLREASPRVLEKSIEKLGHLSQFAVVFDAEMKFRGCELASDWTVKSVDGKWVVRTVYRTLEEGTEH